MFRKTLFLALLSVALLSAPWLGGPGYTLLLAFVPLLVMQHRGVRGFAWWIMGVMVSWIMVTTWWVGLSTLIATAAVPLVGLCFSWLPFMIYHAVWRRAPRALAYTVLVCGWMVFEKMYMVTDVSFPWLMLGNGFANDPIAVQWYSVTGAFGGTLWVLVSNILYFELWKRWIASRGELKVRMWLPAFVWLVVPMVISVGMYYGYAEGQGQGVQVTVVQPNIDPYTDKFKGMSQQQQLDLILSLADRAPQGVDYIVTPETSIDNNLWLESLPTSSVLGQVRTFLRANYPGATMVMGATTMREVMPSEPQTPTVRQARGFRYQVFNSALWVDSSAVTNHYHKSKLVIGVESTPAIFGQLGVDLGGISGNLGRQADRAVFENSQGVSTGTAICYESIYGEYFTQYVRNGAQLMFVITNDGWWGDTFGHRHHMSYSRLRAIETRRSIARSANTGISAFINGRGDVLQELGWWQQGVISQELVPDSRMTVYVRWGDFLVRISGYVLGLSLLYFVALRYRSKK